MRKVSLILAILLFAAPALAQEAVVVISCDINIATGVVTVYYDATGSPNDVRAFALDISVDKGVITSVEPNIVGESEQGNKGYGIFPSSFAQNIDPNDPNWEDPNYSPLGDPCDLPGDTKPGLDTNAITVEMGALYSEPIDSSPNAPGDGPAVLLTFTIAGINGGSVNVTIEENEGRGGVVLTDPTIDPNVVITGCGHECYTGVNPGPNTDGWDEVGKPDCWCVSYTGDGTKDYRRQCLGDGNGSPEGKLNYWVSTQDLTLLLSAWNKPYPLADPTWICADFTHTPEGKLLYRASTQDLTVLLTNWNQANGPPPTCP